MTFPISVHFNKRLKATITADNQQKILQYITKSILDDKADNIVVKDAQVAYRGSTSKGRGSLFGSVDNGTFKLIYKDDSWWLNYQINMPELFLVAATLSIIMGVFVTKGGGPWWVGIVGFLWLCGVNWVIIFIRHQGVAASIAAGIDELICGKPEPSEPELPEQDKMTGKLKSWF